MARKRWLFSEEFKREAVKLLGQPGASKAGIARDISVGANLLGRWCREANVDGHAGGTENVTGQNHERMRRELAKVKTESDILKKRSATSQPTSSEVRFEPYGPREPYAGCSACPPAASTTDSTDQ